MIKEYGKNEKDAIWPNYEIDSPTGETQIIQIDKDSLFDALYPKNIVTANHGYYLIHYYPKDNDQEESWDKYPIIAWRIPSEDYIEPLPVLVGENNEWQETIHNGNISIWMPDGSVVSRFKYACNLTHNNVSEWLEFKRNEEE